MSRLSISLRLSKISVNRNGITLIELLVAISLASIISSAVALIFEASMEAWRFGDEMASIEAVLPPLINKICEGDYAKPGIVDALVVTNATGNTVSFAPLVLDVFEPEPFRNPDQIFTLSRPFQAGSPLPKGQVRPGEESVFRNVRTVFLSGREQNPPVDEDAVQFVDPLPEDGQIRVIYRPDHTKDPAAIMTLAWQSQNHEFTREYTGAVESLAENNFGVEISDVVFQYFSNSNEEITASDGSGILSGEERNRVTAARIMAAARKGETKKTVTQFVNMRNLGWATGGVVIFEGSELTIPTSLLIRALALVNISGISDRGKLKLEAESVYGDSWTVSMNFGLVEGKPLLLDYRVEYPAGRTVLERSVFQPVSKGFDLLTFDEEGRYDYDDDQGVDDTVLLEDEPVTLRVTTMEIGGASLYIRP